MFGHGAKHCFRNNVCIACGGDHDFSTCTVNKTPQMGPAIFKCFNCTKRNLKNTNHRADDPRCPCRKDYILLRQKLKNKYSYNLMCRKFYLCIGTYTIFL